MRARRIPAWALAAAGGVLILSCAAPSSKSERRKPVATVNEEEKEPAKPVQSAGPEWRQRLDRHLGDENREAAAAEREALGHVDVAKAYFESGNLKKAEAGCRRALEIWPECVEAYELMQRIRKARRKGGK